MGKSNQHRRSASKWRRTATPILFLHGVGSDKSVWHPQLAHFAPQRRAIAIDYPGYGDSDARPDATRDDFASAALDALDALGIERAHICGLSLGGVVAIAMHHLAPDALRLADPRRQFRRPPRRRRRSTSARSTPAAP